MFFHGDLRKCGRTDAVKQLPAKDFYGLMTKYNVIIISSKFTTDFLKKHCLFKFHSTGLEGDR